MIVTTRQRVRVNAITPAHVLSRTPVREWVEAAGKFLSVEQGKFYARGVTYGPFRPDERGNEYGTVKRVRADFERMAENGFNAVRTYTVPPPWLIEAAQEQGLRLLVGIPWEQHITFLDDRKRARSIVAKVREAVRSTGRNPAVFAYAVGNEIPAPIVRWYGRKRIEAFVRDLYDAAKEEAPEALVTYVNYPTTEYLQLPFLDFSCFNVYLEQPERLQGYLAHLQHLAGDRPLIMTEIGLDSRRNGEHGQARSLQWQLRSVFEAGCAGAFVFAWTDEWHRGGYDVVDWDFGLTDRSGTPKPALEVVRQEYAAAPVVLERTPPFISVVVCVYNGAQTLDFCLEGLGRLDYPRYEVIVVDDGSTDASAAIASKYRVRLIRTDNRGLSSARNVGLLAARGEIVAYIDADASPDPHWLNYLSVAFARANHAGVGGPNLAPPECGLTADCVAHAPGGPLHVLLTDELAEHVPGCNMAFRRDALEEIGGFDPQFRVAGDDVDICWRIRERGWTIGFNAGAVVWHCRRNSIRGYWRWQREYGKSEAMVERKWPGKYNRFGHVAWSDGVYGIGACKPLPLGRSRVYQGEWGSALFQSIYSVPTGTLLALPLMPEWLLIVLALGVVSALGAFWTPLLLAVPLLLGAVGLYAVQAVAAALQARLPVMRRRDRWRRRCLIALLHFLQPAARLRGRLKYGLSPWMKRGTGFMAPVRRQISLWSEQWRPARDWLSGLQSALVAQHEVVNRGGEYDRWDLEAWCGPLGGVRLLMTTEEHGWGKQLVRFGVWPRVGPCAWCILAVFAALSSGAALSGAWSASLILTLMTLLLSAGVVRQCGVATSSVIRTIRQWENER
jgi:O-antigen biosynthesis protein